MTLRPHAPAPTFRTRAWVAGSELGPTATATAPAGSTGTQRTASAPGPSAVTEMASTGSMVPTVPSARDNPVASAESQLSHGPGPDLSGSSDLTHHRHGICYRMLHPTVRCVTSPPRMMTELGKGLLQKEPVTRYSPGAREPSKRPAALVLNL